MKIFFKICLVNFSLWSGRGTLTNLSALLFFLISFSSPVPVRAESGLPALQIEDDQAHTLKFSWQNPNLPHDPALFKASQMWNCEYCSSQEKPGAPHLPVLRLPFALGPDPVEASVYDLVWLTLPGAPEPQPVSDHPSAKEALLIKNDSLYRSLAQFSWNTSPATTKRGRWVSHLQVPAAIWDPLQKELKVLRSFRVQINFPSSSQTSRPQAQIWPKSWDKEILNPNGAQFLRISGTSKEEISRRGLYKSAKLNLAANNPVRPSYHLFALQIKISTKQVVTLGAQSFYALRADTLLAQMKGLSVARGLPLADLRLWTGAQHYLPLPVENPVRAHNWRQVPFEIFDKNNNGIFDGADEIQFYAQGPNDFKKTASYLSDEDNALHPLAYTWKTDPFTFENNYLLTLDPSIPKVELQNKNLRDSLSSAPLFTSSWQPVRIESDRETGFCDAISNLDKETGMQWFHVHLDVCKGNTLSGKGVKLSGLNHPVLTGLETQAPLYIGLGEHVISHNYKLFPNKSVPQELKFNYPDQYGYNWWFIDNYQGSTNQVLDSLIWFPSDPGFDGVTLQYFKKWVYDPSNILGQQFFAPLTSGQVQLRVTDLPSGSQVYKIEEGIAVAKLPHSSEGRFVDNIDSTTDTRYQIYTADRLQTFKKSDLVYIPPPLKSQYLLNLSQGPVIKPEHLIITPKIFLNSALRLAEHRSTSDYPVRSQVVLLDDIYREFGGGRHSVPAIRDFLRYAYQGYQAQENKPDTTLKYVLFFGDGHYDYRYIRTDSTQYPSFIPTFQKRADATEDYFAYLDSSERVENSSLNLDLALGRLPVGSMEEAQAVVNKILDFENSSNFGPWRNRVLTTADDEAYPGSASGFDFLQGHTNDAEAIMSEVKAGEPGKGIESVYLLNYAKNPNGAKPEASQDLLNQFNRGVLSANYVGHGSAEVWADEALLVLSKALPRLENDKRTMLLTSFSCTVGRFDRVAKQGLSESFVAADKVGALATVSALRESYAAPNVELAKLFYRFLYKDPSTPLRLGDALRLAKAQSGSVSNNERYSLLGDPAVFLRAPDLKISLQNTPDTLKALQCGVFSGKIEGGSGAGQVFVEVRGQSKTKVFPDIFLNGARVMKEQVINQRGDILFSGQTSYKQGEYSLPYFIPKRIPQGDTAAEIRLYAWDNKFLREGTLLKSPLPIQGTANSCAGTDTTGPQITLAGCERSKSSLTPFPAHIKVPIPYCIEITAEDSTGGVFSPMRPDEGLTIEIMGRGGPFRPTLAEDDFQRKSYKWQVGTDIKPGTYKLKIQAQDGFGNTSVRNQTVEFASQTDLNLYKIFNWPNPVRSQGTCFQFGLIDRLETGEFYVDESEISAEIRIYSQAGHLLQVLPSVKPVNSTLQQTQAGCMSRGAWWDLHDHLGNKMANGVYFYTVTLRKVVPGEKTQTVVKKGTMAISR